jgi:hypothetical protein
LGRAGLEVAGLLCRLLLGCVGQVSFYSIFFLFSFSSYFLFLNSVFNSILIDFSILQVFLI